jgi:hypothetical protein
MPTKKEYQGASFVNSASSSFLSPRGIDGKAVVPRSPLLFTENGKLQDTTHAEASYRPEKPVWCRWKSEGKIRIAMG